MVLRVSSQTEASVLGSVLLHGGSWWERVLESGEDYLTLFQDGDHLDVAQVYNALYESTGEISHPAVVDSLRRTTSRSVENVEQIVSSMSRSAPLRTLEQLDAAVSELLSARASRDQTVIIEEAQKALGDGLDPSAVKEILEKSADVSMPTTRIPTMTELIDEIEMEESPDWAVPVGLSELDRCLDGGWESGKPYVVAAASKVGKTTFMFSAIERALTAGAAVVVFSLETIKVDFFNKMMANLSGLDRNTVIKPFNAERDVAKKKTMLENMDDDDRESLIESRKFLRQTKLYPVFESDITGFDDIPTMVKQVQKMNPGVPVLVFIDHLGLLVNNMDKKDERLQLQHFTKSIARMCRNLQVATIMLVQIRRIEEGQEPQPGHLRGSGSIEQDANSVILLHRKRTAMMSVSEEGDVVDSGDGLDANTIQIHLALNRSGPTTKFTANFHGAIDLIEDMEDEEEDNSAYL